MTMKKVRQFTDRAGRTVKVYERRETIIRTTTVEFRDGEVWALWTEDDVQDVVRDEEE